MQISMMREDNMVTIGGEGRYVDLSTMPKKIHAVQYDTVEEKGMVELLDLSGGDKEYDRPIKNAGQFATHFQRYADDWNMGGEPPAEPLPTPSTPAEIIDNTYQNNKAYQAFIDYTAGKEGRSSSALLTDLKALVLV